MRSRTPPATGHVVESFAASNVAAQVDATSNDKTRSTSTYTELVVRVSSKASAAGVPEWFDEVADTTAKSIDSDQGSQHNGNSCPLTAPRSKPKLGDSMVTNTEQLPRNSNYTPLGPDRRVVPRSSEDDQARRSEKKSGCLQRPELPVRSNASTIIAIPPPRPIQGASPCRTRAESLDRSTLRSVSSISLVSTRWAHDRANFPNKLTPQKRLSGSDTTNRSNDDNKKPRLEMHDGLDPDQQPKKLIQEDIQHGERSRQFSDRGNGGQGATSEYEKIRKLSNQRNGIGSQMLNQPYRPSATRSDTSGAFRDRYRGSASSLQQMPRLPHNSPLNNVINSASVQEEIVQARLKFNLAQIQLNKEKAKRGSASRAVSARVTDLKKTLAALHRRRAEIKDDGGRMDAFRRSDTTEHEHECGPLTTRTTPRSPPLSPTGSEWKSRLTLCYEALEQTERWHEAVMKAGRESATLSAEDRPMIKEKASDQDVLVSHEEHRGRVLAPAERRHVRFTLTDVETFL